MASEFLMIKVLNTGGKPDDAFSMDALAMSRGLQQLMLRLKGNFMFEGDKCINYELLKESELFQEYSTLANQLQNVDLASLEEAQRKVFVINIYNALCIHGIASLSMLPHSVLDIQQFWKTTAYKIGSHVYSLDDLEHGILRGNRPHPTSVEPTFKKNDSRLKYSLTTLDPRVHFALNCGAKSCPPIRVYSESNVHSALDMATQIYCDQEIQVDLKHRMIVMNRLFQWYRKDFGCNETEVIKWSMRYVKPEKAFALNQMLQELEDIGGVTISYSEYDWGLNNLPQHI